MALNFACPRCGEDIPVASTDDALPDIKIKVRRVERACRSCGSTVRGLGTPADCPECGTDEPAWTPAERIVTESVTVEVCSSCQDDLDTESEILAAIKD